MAAGGGTGEPGGRVPRSAIEQAPAARRGALHPERRRGAEDAPGAELEIGAYRPGAYRLFTVYDRKPRLICAAPFRDRVVHHALMRVTEPLLDRRMHPHSYACRAGKGVHAAVEQYQIWARRYTYVLKLDIRKYISPVSIMSC